MNNNGKNVMVTLSKIDNKTFNLSFVSPETKESQTTRILITDTRKRVKIGLICNDLCNLKHFQWEVDSKDFKYCCAQPDFVLQHEISKYSSDLFKYESMF